MMPEDVGIGALPVPDEMIPGLAGGGIIAFQNRGLVEGQESNMYTGLSEDIAALQAAKEAFVGPNQSVADLIAYNQEAEKRAAERAKSQFNTRLIEAGLLGLGGDSEYFGVNMGRMAPAVKGMSEDTEKQAEAKEARIKSELAAKGIERKEKETTFGQTLADRAGREKIAPEAFEGLEKSKQQQKQRVPQCRHLQKRFGNTQILLLEQQALLRFRRLSWGLKKMQPRLLMNFYQTIYLKQT
jgi:hypothetical protein